MTTSRSASAASTATTDRTGTAHEVSSEEVTDGWGRVQFRPSGYLGFRREGRRRGARPGQVRRDRRGRVRPEPAHAQVQHGVSLPLLRRVARQRRGRIAAALARRERVLRRRQLPAVGPGPGCRARSALRRRPELDRQREDRGLCDARAREDRLAHEGQQHLHDGRLGGDRCRTTSRRTARACNAQFTDKIGVNLDYTYGAGNSRTQHHGRGRPAPSRS